MTGSPATLAKPRHDHADQLCAEDYDAALEYWTTKMGAGPFFHTEGVQVENVKFRGEPSDIQFSMAIGYWGEIQVELIRPDNDAHHRCSANGGKRACRGSSICV